MKVLLVEFAKFSAFNVTVQLSFATPMEASMVVYAGFSKRPL